MPKVTPGSGCCAVDHRIEESGFGEAFGLVSVRIIIEALARYLHLPLLPDCMSCLQIDIWVHFTPVSPFGPIGVEMKRVLHCSFPS